MGSTEGKRQIGSVQTAVISGVAAQPVIVEVNVVKGLPGISIVGMPDTAVNEAKLRVRQAMRSCGFTVPNMHIVVNLAPSSLPKSGSGLDLPIAASILMATSQIPAALLQNRLCVGELSLDGSVRPVKGMLAYEKLAAENGSSLLSAVVERGAGYAQTADGQTAHHCIESLSDLRHAHFQQPLSGATSCQGSDIDYCDIAGNELAKRALQIAAAGAHCLLMIGPPGSGKSMLAARLPTILPPLSLNQRRESAMIHSVSGLPYDRIIQGHKPFRAPHHSATRAGLLGGGSPPAPGEVSLAHNGVLFLDEMPEFGSSVLQLLRQPIETGTVSLARARGTTIFPASFILIAAANPCPCGYYGDPDHTCKCSPVEIARYQGRIGGPLIDRFDMIIDVWRSKPGDVLATGSGRSSAAMLRDVLAAREFRQERLKQPFGQCVGESMQGTSAVCATQIADPTLARSAGAASLSRQLPHVDLTRAQSAVLAPAVDTARAERADCPATRTGIQPNADKPGKCSTRIAGKRIDRGFNGEGYRLLQSCALGQQERRCIEEAAQRFELSGRGIMRALSVARTIADLEGSDAVQCAHLLEAVTFRAESRLSNGRA
ncbi:MAG: YifB family Mg chelatase-like AAA ATPase [Coriobacteriales bacterium]|jgi:magnesium chelatase family protein|nr:YifB family Mg chelatase-like AAA ATPase [Coriobacteriales bacterium]